jgi:hypothetical protein
MKRVPVELHRVVIIGNCPIFTTYQKDKAAHIKEIPGACRNLRRNETIIIIIIIVDTMAFVCMV